MTMCILFALNESKIQNKQPKNIKSDTFLFMQSTTLFSQMRFHLSCSFFYLKKKTLKIGAIFIIIISLFAPPPPQKKCIKAQNSTCFSLIRQTNLNGTILNLSHLHNNK